jgi:serine/threonine protein kinase
MKEYQGNKPEGVRFVPLDIMETGRKMLNDAKDVKKLYKLEMESGSGGFGSVFLAKDLRRKTRVAVKRLNHETPKEIDANLGEVGFLAKCEHPNIVKLLDAHFRPGDMKRHKPDEAWIVLEFLHGGTLKRAAQAHRFTDNHVAFVAREIFRGLDYLHKKGWVHRDIKSANIMLDARGLIKIIDFGLCTETKVSGPRTGMAGSRYWLAPEIILRIPHSAPVDVWAAGVCLLEMFVGKPPYHPHPVRCMFHACTRGLMDKLPNDATDHCKDFFSTVFVIDHTKRATVPALLKHPWVTRDGIGHGIDEVFRTIFFQNALTDMMGFL